MAKKKATQNKSAAIRDYIKKHPGKSNVEVAAAVSKAGFKVNAQYVAVVKSNSKSKTKTKKAKAAPSRRGRPATAARAKKRASAGDERVIDIEALMEVKKIVDRIGPEAAHDAITLVEQLRA